MKRLIPILVVAAAFAAPGVASATNGVVLKVDQKSKLCAVAQPSSNVALVHTGARLHVGERVSLNARTLKNGTLAATKVSVVGRASHVKFRGFLMKRDRSRAVLSAGGAVVTVANKDTTPAPAGTPVTVTATVASDGEIEAEDISPFTAATPGGRIEGHLVLPTITGAIGAITIVSEKMALVLKVPAGFDLTPFHNGDEVLAEFSQSTDGSLVLTKLSGNDDAQEADDEGEISSGNGDHGDHHGDHGGGGGNGGGGDDDGD